MTSSSGRSETNPAIGNASSALTFPSRTATWPPCNFPTANRRANVRRVVPATTTLCASCATRGSHRAFFQFKSTHKSHARHCRSHDVAPPRPVSKCLASVSATILPLLTFGVSISLFRHDLVRDNLDDPDLFALPSGRYSKIFAARNADSSCCVAAALPCFSPEIFPILRNQYSLLVSLADLELLQIIEDDEVRPITRRDRAKISQPIMPRGIDRAPFEWRVIGGTPSSIALRTQWSM